ncbi:hypothetical protein ACTODO_02085 [Schaalia dentiphila ATCC 17982]|uniref:Uncharacterized protein n=1 Tax=Schaalia dentiphila ATCC 17982 TaxID=411466 RepID=A7BEI3_9ACTO|nr:hypothetical protein ACTODO_02085 [Schaalia odontolytica ATCC 17982]
MPSLVIEIDRTTIPSSEQGTQARFLHSSHTAIKPDYPVKAFENADDGLFKRFRQTLISLSPIQFD